MAESAPRRSPALRWTTLAFMTIACTGSVAQLSASAEYGLGAVTLYLLPALLFLLPVALVASELATGWKGGVFEWVTEAMGERTGFQAIWLQFIQSVVLYPSLLSFGAASLAYTFADPSLAGNGLYTGVVILVVFWGATFVATRGIGATAAIASKGVIVGTMIPIVSLIVLMFAWLAAGKPSSTPLEASDIVPNWTGITSIVLIVSNFIAFAGLEVNAVHVRNLQNPGRNLPRSLAMAAGIIVVMYISGSIAVSVAVPGAALNLNAGAAQAFTIFGDGFGIPWLGQALSALLVVGVLAAATSWVAGPSRGLLLVGRRGFLPPALQRVNGVGAQVPILVAQGIVVTALATVFVLVPSVSAAFWILQAMTIILYLCMYILMFTSAIRLRRRRPDVVRTFRTPAMPVVASIGILASIAAIGIALVPPAQFGNRSAASYAGILLVGVVVLAVPPQILYKLRRPSWVGSDESLEAVGLEVEEDVEERLGGFPSLGTAD
jgi:amino acid transporter